MKRSPSRLPLISAALAVVLMAVVPVSRLLSSRQPNVYSTIEKKFRIMNQILYHINDLYFEEVDMEELMEGAFEGIMGKLDPHSLYISARQQEEVDELFRGRFQGIGIEFDILHGYVTVISPVAESPAERAGLLPGDQIIKIDGRDAYRITREEVYKTLRGAKGTRVDLTIQRVGTDPFPVTIIRDDIPIYSVRATLLLDATTGYIWLTRFSASTGDEVRQALTELEGQGMRRLLLDLRNNSGGILDQAADIANLFIARRDTLVYTRGKKRAAEQVFIADPAVGREHFALIILLNRGSASASEIVAGAIQDLDRGLIAGETSFGKGLVQRQVGLSDGSVIRVTIARYYTPSGRLIQRPYDPAKNHQYYQEVYSADREAKLDSLRKLRPRYSTRSGRTVYGGGGITPDVHLAWSPRAAAVQKITSHPKRPLFNWGSTYASLHPPPATDYNQFRLEWQLGEEDFQDFLDYLQEEGIETDAEALRNEQNYLLTMLKAQVAGVYWGKDEAIGIQLLTDNQVMEARNYFDQADAFLKTSQ